MAVAEQVAEARKAIYRDGYDMSFGEIASLYQRGELIIYPAYQRLFRWDSTNKSRFIESLLLNIPIPPIFVFSDPQGRWELVDGLQRVATVLEFMGILRDPNGSTAPRFVCDGTSLIPDLQGKYWALPDEAEQPDHLPPALQVSIRRSRLRVEILNAESDARTKYELFQRLNSGGVHLSEQEVRNCVIIAINPGAYGTIESLAGDTQFVALTEVGRSFIERQYRLELVVRFLVLRNVPYTNGMDVHEYLDKGITEICSDSNFNWLREAQIFRDTMRWLGDAVGSDAFKKNDRFSLGFYEFIVLGLSKAIERGVDTSNNVWLSTKLFGMTQMQAANTFTGMGVRGTQRLSRFVLPIAESYFVD